MSSRKLASSQSNSSLNSNLPKLLSYLILSLFLFACNTPTDKNKSSGSPSGSSSTEQKNPFIGNTYEVIVKENKSRATYNIGEKIYKLHVLDDLKIEAYDYGSNTVKSLNSLPSDGKIDDISFDRLNFKGYLKADGDSEGTWPNLDPFGGYLVLTFKKI